MTHVKAFFPEILPSTCVISLAAIDRLRLPSFLPHHHHHPPRLPLTRSRCRCRRAPPPINAHYGPTWGHVPSTGRTPLLATSPFWPRATTTIKSKWLAASAPSLSRGMWASMNRWFRGRETRGGTQEVGGPSGASRKRATTFVVARFLRLFLSIPATNNF